MIERVRLKNFKSVERCDVTLRPFTVLVGRNGAGKSNFIDALVFVAESLRAPLPDPIARRGSFRDMTYQRRGGAIDIEIGFRTQDGVAGEFGVQLERGEVRQESLLLSNGARYSRTGRAASVWIDDKGSATAIASDGLALGPLATFEQFRGAFQALASVHAYRRLDPEAMRSPQEPYAADRLSSDGSNLTRVWARLYKEEPESIGRVTDYLAAIAPGVRSIVPVRIDTYDVLRFHQAFGDGEISLPASSMSDGTLRALAILVASRTPSSAVVVEEPETALHPGAVAVLMDALHEASEERQIIITSHSPDVLDRVDLDHDALLVTEWRDGATVIAPVDAASAEAIRRDLYTPGDLLRMDHLQPGLTHG